MIFFVRCKCLFYELVFEVEGNGLLMASLAPQLRRLANKGGSRPRTTAGLLSPGGMVEETRDAGLRGSK